MFGECKHGVSFDEGHFTCEECKTIVPDGHTISLPLVGKVQFITDLLNLGHITTQQAINVLNSKDLSECKHGSPYKDDCFKCDVEEFNKVTATHIEQHRQILMNPTIMEEYTNNPKLDTTQGKKFDDDKSQMDFIPYEALDEMGKVFAFGAKKYNESSGEANWSKGLKISRLIAATFRHMGKFVAGYDLDEESGLSHLGHAMVNIAMIIWTLKHKPEFDNRWIKFVKKQETK